MPRPARGGSATKGLESLNLALRFLLELAALAAFVFWGWATHTGAARVAWAVGLPLLAAAAWGVFRVDGDPGKAPVRVPGVLRLLLELAYFGGSVGALAAAGRPTLALILGIIVVLHYAASYRRLAWLTRQR